MNILPRQTSLRQVLVLWLTVTFAYCYAHQDFTGNAMVKSRLDLLHALVSQKTFAIDAYESNTPDKSINGSHFFCDKAPGVVFLALPGFLISAEILSIVGVPLDSPDGWLVSSWCSVALSLGIITSLGAVCVFLWLQDFVSQRVALLSTFVIAFGTLSFAYATMLMSHAVAAAFFAIALFLLRRGGNRATNAEKKGKIGWRDLLGGAACGFAIACEYDAALVAGSLLTVVCFGDLKRGIHLILGAVPPLLLIPIYNWICTGNLLVLPYSHEVVFTEMNNGFYGIRLPDANNMGVLLFSPGRGLFCWTPFFLLVYVGYARLYREQRELFLLCYFVPIMQVVVISGYFFVQGGTSLGPRFLAPILPLLILPASFGAARLPRVAVVLAAFSIMLSGGATLIDACPHEDNPIFDFYIPALLKGKVAHNLGELVGLKGLASDLPLIILLGIGAAYLLWTSGEKDGKAETTQAKTA